MELGSKNQGSLSAKLDRILEKLNEQADSRTKKYDLPWKIKWGMKPKIKKGYILLFFIQPNRVIDLLFRQVVEEEVRINDVPYKIPMDAIFLYQGKIPAALLPSWALEAVKVTEIYDHERDYAAVQKTILRNMKKEQLFGTPVKSGFGVSPLIWILAAVAAVYIGYSIWMGARNPGG